MDWYFHIKVVCKNYDLGVYVFMLLMVSKINTYIKDIFAYIAECKW